MNTAEMEKRFDNGIEYRYTKKIEIRASEKKEDENSYIVEGYASTFDEEYNMGECDNFRCLEKLIRMHSLIVICLMLLCSTTIRAEFMQEHRTAH